MIAILFALSLHHKWYPFGIDIIPVVNPFSKKKSSHSIVQIVAETKGKYFKIFRVQTDIQIQNVECKFAFWIYSFLTVSIRKTNK